MSDDSNRMDYREYREQVVWSAECIIEETVENEGETYPVDTDRFVDLLREETHRTVGHHDWIIYTGYQVGILANADADPNDYEWEVYVDRENEDDWRAYVRQMARVAFEADIWEVVERKHDELVEGAIDRRDRELDGESEADARAEIEAEAKLEEQYARHVDRRGY